MKIKNYAMNIIGSSLLAFGVCAFIVPFDIIVGGATGIGIIVHKLTNIPISIIVLIINVSVLPIGYFLGNKKLVFGSILSSLVYPIAMAICEQIPFIYSISDNIFLSVICGGFICGIGIGLVIKSGGSTGGMDIPDIIISKYTNIPINTVMNAIDVIIMICQMPFCAISRILYGMVYTYIMTNSISKVMVLGVDKYRVNVVSEYHEEITQSLLDNDFGVTLSYAQSGYTKKEIKEIESVVHVKQLNKIQNIIENIDPTAFITIEKVSDVKGRGYTLDKMYLNK